MRHLRVVKRTSKKEFTCKYRTHAINCRYSTQVAPIQWTNPAHAGSATCSRIGGLLIRSLRYRVGILMIRSEESRPLRLQRSSSLPCLSADNAVDRLVLSSDNVWLHTVMYKGRCSIERASNRKTKSVLKEPLYHSQVARRVKV